MQQYRDLIWIFFAFCSLNSDTPYTVRYHEREFLYRTCKEKYNYTYNCPCSSRKPKFTDKRFTEKPIRSWCLGWCFSNAQSLMTEVFKRRRKRSLLRRDFMTWRQAVKFWKIHLVPGSFRCCFSRQQQINSMCVCLCIYVCLFVSLN